MAFKLRLRLRLLEKPRSRGRLAPAPALQPCFYLILRDVVRRSFGDENRIVKKKLLESFKKFSEILALIKSILIVRVLLVALQSCFEVDSFILTAC